MLKLLLLLVLSTAAIAQEQKPSVEALQAALQWSQGQTNACNAQQLQMAADLDVLRRKVQSLEEQLKKPAEPKK